MLLGVSVNWNEPVRNDPIEAVLRVEEIEEVAEEHAGVHGAASNLELNEVQCILVEELFGSLQDVELVSFDVDLEEIDSPNPEFEADRVQGANVDSLSQISSPRVVGALRVYRRDGRGVPVEVECRRPVARAEACLMGVNPSDATGVRHKLGEGPETGLEGVDGCTGAKTLVDVSRVLSHVSTHVENDCLLRSWSEAIANVSECGQFTALAAVGEPKVHSVRREGMEACEERLSAHPAVAKELFQKSLPHPYFVRSEETYAM